jgi:hypothetical protein
MPKFLVELFLDGYNTEEEMAEACENILTESFDSAASSITVTRLPDDFTYKTQTPYLEYRYISNAG